MTDQMQPQTSTSSASCEELSGSASADLSVIDGCFLCTFKRFDVWLRNDWTGLPSIKSPQFQLGPFKWEVAIFPGSNQVVHYGRQVAVSCMLANRAELVEKGLGKLLVPTQFTLTIVTGAKDVGRDARGFQHDFTAVEPSHQCGSLNIIQFNKLKRMRAEYCPALNGDLHVRVELRLMMEPATREVFRDWHWHVGSSIMQKGSSPLHSLHKQSLKNVDAGAGQKSTQCIEQGSRQLQSQQTSERSTQTSCHKQTQQSSQRSGQQLSSEQSSPSRNSQANQEGLLACQSSRAALDHAAAALQDVNKRTAKLHVANSRLLGVMTALSSACTTMETDMQYAEAALEQARAALSEAEFGFGAPTTDATPGAGQAVGGAGKAASGRYVTYYDAGGNEGVPSRAVA
eukprot:jgi/Ulvmu1/3538/UM164_0004.1